MGLAAAAATSSKAPQLQLLGAFWGWLRLGSGLKHLTSVCSAIHCTAMLACLACRRRQEHRVELQRRAHRHAAHADRGTPRRHHLPGAAGAACACALQDTGSWQLAVQSAGRVACLCSPAGQPPFRCLPESLPRHCPHLPPPLQSWQPDQEGWLATAGKDGRVYVYDVDSAVAMRDGMPLICPPGAIGLTEGAWVAVLTGVSCRLAQRNRQHCLLDPCTA